MDTRVLKSLERKLAVLNSVNCFLFKLLESFQKKIQSKTKLSWIYIRYFCGCVGKNCQRTGLMSLMSSNVNFICANLLLSMLS